MTFIILGSNLYDFQKMSVSDLNIVNYKMKELE